MALGKSVPGIYGPAMTYWRLISTHSDMDKLSISAKFNGYPDKAASDAAAVPMAVIDMTRPFANVAAMDGITFAQMYTYAKTQPFFSGATDV
jgi:hypothetical protein